MQNLYIYFPKEIANIIYDYVVQARLFDLQNELILNRTPFDSFIKWHNDTLSRGLVCYKPKGYFTEIIKNVSFWFECEIVYATYEFSKLKVTFPFHRKIYTQTDLS